MIASKQTYLLWMVIIAQIKTNNLHHNKINRNIENNTKDKE